MEAIEALPLVSIVVPLYNKEDYIVDTLSSILDQTFSDFEVLIINDGSTDNSLEALKQINDVRVKIINQTNQGVAVARNTGISYASGAWLSFLDADDLWDKEFLSKMTGMLKLYPKGEIFASGRNLKYNNICIAYNNPLLPPQGSSSSVDYLEIIKKYLPPINSSSCLINKDLLIKSGGFKPGMKNYEDHDLWIRIAFDRPIYFLNEPLSIYRKDVDMNNSGSKCSLRASDFKSYLETLRAVKSKVDSPQKVKNLEHYTFRFCNYNYLLNAHYFNSTDKKELRSLMKKVVTNNHYWRLFLITNINTSVIRVLVNIYRSRKSR